VIAGRLRKQVPGLLVTKVDLSARYYDSTAAWRERAIGGQLHSGRLARDPRSTDRKIL